MAGKVPPPGAAKKYPFVDMNVGSRVSLMLFPVEDPRLETRLRKAASAVCRRNGWVITGEKLAPDLITFVRVS